MQRKSSITILALTVLLLAALTIVTGHWLAGPVAAESPSDTPRDSVVDQELDRGEFFTATLFEEEDEDERFDEDEEVEEDFDEEDFDEEDDEDFDEGEHEEELELHHRHLELERAELETNFGRLELVSHIAKVAGDELLSAAFAITHVMEFMEDEEEVIDFLNNALNNTRNPAVKRLIHMKLAEVYAHTDQPDLARDQLRALIVSE